MKELIIIFFLEFLFIQAIPIRRQMFNERNGKTFSSFQEGMDLPEEKWFNQTLDHFNFQDSRTWKQRYFVNDSFFNSDLEGSPIFLLIQGEGPANPFDVMFFQMSVWAQQYGALQFAVEHRFYGQSQPFSDWSTENLQYLSSEQALADLANFVEKMKEIYNAQNSPVITFGGSYSGDLASWFRLKYPHVTIGSVASSAPVQATLDFFEYLDVVEESLSDITGIECDQNIAEATKLIQQMLETQNGQNKIETLFNTCSSFKNQNDISNFMSSIMGWFMSTVQYDNEGNSINIPTLCDIMNNGTDLVGNYVKVNQLFMGSNCLDISYQDMIKQISNITIDKYSGNRQWTYQTCVEFGFFQTTDSPNQPFGDLVPLSFYTNICQDVFGFNFLPRINDTNYVYGGKHPGSTNIIFINGSLDPWHSLGITKTLSDSLQAIYIQGTAHCADMFRLAPNDPPGLGAAHEQIGLQISKWLSNY